MSDSCSYRIGPILVSANTQRSDIVIIKLYRDTPTSISGEALTICVLASVRTPRERDLVV